MGRFATYKGRLWRQSKGHPASRSQIKREIRNQGYKILKPGEIKQTRNIGTLKNMGAIEEEPPADLVYRHKMTLGYARDETDVEYEVLVYTHEPWDEDKAQARLEKKIDRLQDLYPSFVAAHGYLEPRPNETDYIQINAAIPRYKVVETIGLWYGNVEFMKFDNGRPVKGYPQEYEAQGAPRTAPPEKQTLQRVTPLKRSGNLLHGG